ncbi:hypothetical protein TGAMA5MH_05267 [Trichoderma gamsii]|uniref:Uncharacterized protein n=1 Tax=Trichoderma gamsii TaxID=398673 RepID=A0A2K0TAH5_9HYPO|nr:hypothetical protein TGAMA5MH_05267 [Trichoderma gamsii]
MGGSKKNRRKNPTDDGGVDLLSLAFNLPTRRDIERADREAAQAQSHSQSIRIQYDPGDESSDNESLSTLDLNASKPTAEEVDETPKAQKSSKPRPERQLKPKGHIFQRSSPRHKPKRVDAEPSPTCRASKRDSSKARERSSSSPATLRASSPASSIPSSATFPRSTSNYSQPQFYQPVFAFPAGSVYPPTQYYPALTKADSASDAVQHVPFPLYTLAPTNMPKSHQPSSISQEVQRIQSKLDKVVVELSKHPEDATLRSELSALQTELNTRLNTLLGMTPPKEANMSENSELRDSKTKPKKSTTQSHSITAQREMSPKRKMRHHLCTGCGKVRSSNYHTKHPIVPGGRPSMNYCEDCFEENVEDGALDHHFCYGCGNVRSKEFQRNHPISNGERPFPNYCSVCVEEIRSAEAIADVSMVDFAPSRSHKSSSYTGSARNRTRNGVPAKSSNSGPGPENHQNQLDTLLFSAHTNGSNDVSSLEAKKAPQPLKLSTNGPQLSPSNSSPDSPYYPVRNTGSSQRRAERSPLSSPGSQYGSSPNTSTTPRYQAPYVEDIFSPIHQTSKLPIDNRNSSKFSSYGHRGNIFHPAAPEDEQESVIRSDKAPHSEISEEASDNSTESHTSTDDSAQSTGSKSVKFRSKVDIRLSDSRASSNASSHAKVLEEDIKPNEETIPSRVGIFGTSPKKSQTGYYARTQEPYNSASSFAGEDGDGEAIPERGYRGAFSKDSPATSWLPPMSMSSASGDHWYSSPFAYQSTTAPSIDSYTGFNPDRKSTFNYGSSGGVRTEPGRPPLRATRSAFNSANAGTAAAYPGDGGDWESQRPPPSPTASSQAQGSPESPSNHWKSYTSPYAGGPSTQSSFRKGSSWNNFPSRFDSDCYTMQDDSSFSQSVFSDYSQPSSNPYYQPRKRPFPDLNDYCSFGTWAPRVPGKWAKDYQSTAQPPQQTPYWMSEPIIEEPDSPESSPGKRTNMIEFDEIAISPASASNVTSVLFPDLGSFVDHEHQSDDDSDKENAISKSSRDTSSFD